ncbi:MAG TPA: adenine phosphoribosyltransferase [Caulobacteraceae bacterium]|nr:adenine phosphoribosyltransferase [Caulobacteraceae bacterium]
MNLKDAIRTIPDYPATGIMFRDITTLLGDSHAFAQCVDELTAALSGKAVDKVAGIEARGFILGGAVAACLSAGFIPLRKKGKLPYRTLSVDYALEYGAAEMEMHIDACAAGEHVAIVDDLIATGGTAIAAAQLLRRAGARVDAAAFVIDLPDLGGAEKVRALGIEVAALVAFAGH